MLRPLHASLATSWTGILQVWNILYVPGGKDRTLELHNIYHFIPFFFFNIPNISTPCKVLHYLEPRLKM